MPLNQPKTKVLLAVRFYASGNFLEDIGDTVAVNMALVSRAVFSWETIWKHKFRPILRRKTA